MEASEFESRVAVIAALNDPIRRELYAFVVNEARLVSRDEAAKAAGVPRSVAAFHLDRLADAGLLEVEFHRLSGRRGPGAGRPSKLYRRAERDVAVSLPERRYDLAGRLLAQAITDGLGGDVPGAEAVERAATEIGRSLGEEAKRRAAASRHRANTTRAAVEVLKACGFEPRRDGTDVVLGNCPFRVLAEEYTDLVCGMNLHLIEGVLAALGTRGVEARLHPQPGLCCVRLRAA